MFNDPDPQIISGPQGVYVVDGDYGPRARGYGDTGWNQWELWVKASTPNQSDGFFRLYKNGTFYFEKMNKNLFGPVDMTGMQIEAGGWYTKSIWQQGAVGACSLSAGAVGAVEVSPACQDFHNCRCPPNPPIFNRYIDDVILLKR